MRSSTRTSKAAAAKNATIVAMRTTSVTRPLWLRKRKRRPVDTLY
jgi:hypothetical protein